jgi:hypothetical protein
MKVSNVDQRRFGVLIVDDFENYTDDNVAGEVICQRWSDGFGVPYNGAHVGNSVPPHCELVIVHGGVQSIPLLYINEAGVANSEASLRDWTTAGVGELSLRFRSDSDNATEPLYVAVSNRTEAPAILAHDDPSAVTICSWAQWCIPLQAFADQGINLTNVDKMSVGLGSRSVMVVVGGSDTLYIDNIRLYRS